MTWVWLTVAGATVAGGRASNWSFWGPEGPKAIDFEPLHALKFLKITNFLKFLSGATVAQSRLPPQTAPGRVDDIRRPAFAGDLLLYRGEANDTT